MQASLEILSHDASAWVGHAVHRVRTRTTTVWRYTGKERKTGALAPGQNADYKCMPVALWFPQNWHQDWNVSHCCSQETLLHERTHSTSGSTNSCSTADAKSVWLKQLRHVKSTQQRGRGLTVTLARVLWFVPVDLLPLLGGHCQWDWTLPHGSRKQQTNVCKNQRNKTILGVSSCSAFTAPLGAHICLNCAYVFTVDTLGNFQLRRLN